MREGSHAALERVVSHRAMQQNVRQHTTHAAPPDLFSRTPARAPVVVAQPPVVHVSPVVAAQLHPTERVVLQRQNFVSRLPAMSLPTIHESDESDIESDESDIESDIKHAMNTLLRSAARAEAARVAAPVQAAPVQTTFSVQGTVPSFLNAVDSDGKEVSIPVATVTYTGATGFLSIPTSLQ